MLKPTYFKLSEEIVDILVAKTQSQNRHFFRLLVAYYMSKVASMMRTNIETKDRGVIPVNTYVLNLMPSGAGKGFSTNIMEEEIIEGFRYNFLTKVLPIASATQLTKISTLLQDKDPTLSDEDADAQVKKEYEALGTLAFSFDSGTAPAVKQMRQKLLMSAAGSMNLELDEVGSNLTANVEMLNTFLELYDVGKVKQKLTKNTKENTRGEELMGRTPTNMMLFGTPTKLLDGSKTEEEFKQMLETGYARRMLFGYDVDRKSTVQQTAEELYEALTCINVTKDTQRISRIITNLANTSNFNNVLSMSKENTIHLLEYKIKCERATFDLKGHEDTKKAELAHRYYKAIKLAGAYAFIEGSNAINREHLDSAIQLVEDSGKHFNRIICKEGSYARLARYIADIGKEVTQVDLLEELPFYKGSESQKKDMLSLAVAWGYKHNIIIRKTYVDDIEFLSGEALKETDIDNIQFSYGEHITENFEPIKSAFKDLHKLTSSADGYHYTAHNFVGGYRTSDKAIPGFDLLILDIDDGCSLNSAKELLEGYKALFATTKRHTSENNRFRIILPMSHYLKLSPKDYAKFMENVFNWLPFDTDIATKDIARKWMSAKGHFEYIDGELIDATLFIPQTKKAREQEQKILDTQGMSNMERWFSAKIEIGNRATMLIRYGFMLMDNGYPEDAIRNMLITFNENIADPITPEEIHTKIMPSIQKKIIQKEIKK
jgi:hypothetical protein